MATTGGCLCGTVRWSYDGPTGEMSHCHCSMCRKAHGAPFGTYFSVSGADFRIDAGADAVVAHESSSGFVRRFCGQCGSVTPLPLEGGRVAIPAGAIDGDPGLRPSMHIFTASKAPWHPIDDDLPQHAAYPAGGPAEVPQPSRAGGTAGALRGSCLCGGVAFEVKEPFIAVHNCHCSRCRKARAAAHTTNGFVPESQFRFLRGEELVLQYKVPDAVSFTQAFCKVCGSGMPRIRKDAGIVAIPFGALDDAPSHGAEDHIFVASKAPWHEIAGELPRFDEAAT